MFILLRKILLENSKNNLISNYLFQALNFGLNFGIVTLTAKRLTVDGYGIYSIYMGTIGYIATIADFALATSLTRICNDQTRVKRISGIVLYSILLKFSISIVIFIFATFAILGLNKPLELIVVTFMALTSAVLNPSWIYVSKGKLNTLININTLVKVMSLIFLFNIVQSKEDILPAISIQTTANLIISIMLLLKALSDHKITIHFSSLNRVVKNVVNLLRGTYQYAFASTIFLIYQATIGLSINSFYENDILSYYYAADRLIKIPILITGIFVMHNYSLISQAPEKKQKIANRSLIRILIVSTLFAAIYYYFREEIIFLVYGETFGPMTYFFGILSITPVLHLLGQGATQLKNLHSFNDKLLILQNIALLISSLLIIYAGSLYESKLIGLSFALVTLELLYFISSFGVAIHSKKLSTRSIK